MTFPSRKEKTNNEEEDEKTMDLGNIDQELSLSGKHTNDLTCFLSRSLKLHPLGRPNQYFCYLGEKVEDRDVLSLLTSLNMAA